MFLKNHAQLQILRGWVPFSIHFVGFFDQNREHRSYRACQAKASLADSRQAETSKTYQVKHRISLHSKAKQASQAQQSKKKEKQATKPK